MYNTSMRNFLLFVLVLIGVVTGSAQNIDLEAVQSDENFRWGVRAFHNGFFNDAILSLEKALSYKPDRSLTRLWLGEALYKSGFEEAALNEWQYLLDRDPSSSVVRNRMEVITYRRGLGPELEEETRYVISSEIDGEQNDSYPFRRPTAIHTLADGSVLLVAFGSNEVLLLNVNNQVERVVQGGFKGFDRPFDCLYVADDDLDEPLLFVSEYGRDLILKLKLSGEKITEFGGSGSGDGLLLGPQYLAGDGRGYLYVTDWGNARVNKYDLDGNFILSFGRRGAPKARLFGPTGIVVSGDQVFVADKRSKEILVFDLSGNYLYSFGAGFLTGPEGLLLKGADSLLVADGGRILEFRLKQEIWNTLSDISSYARHLTHLALNPNGELYAVDFDLNKVFVLSQMSSLYTGLYAQVERISSVNYPEILIDVSVEDRLGRPIVGLAKDNFFITEEFQEVEETELIRGNTDRMPLEVVLLVEKSAQMLEYDADLAQAVDSLYSQLSRIGGIQIISVGEKAQVEADFGSSRLETVNAALQSAERSFGWRFDRGLRLAASNLVSRPYRKAVIFLGQGQLSGLSFGRHSLAELTQYLTNNHIGFYSIFFGGEEPAAELKYMQAETGGRSFRYFAPSGISGVVGKVSAQITPLYTLKFKSRMPHEFGERYIHLQLEVVLLRKNGRAESGYFAPLSQ